MGESLTTQCTDADSGFLIGELRNMSRVKVVNALCPPFQPHHLLTNRKYMPNPRPAGDQRNLDSVEKPGIFGNAEPDARQDRQVSAAGPL